MLLLKKGFLLLIAAGMLAGLLSACATAQGGIDAEDSILIGEEIVIGLLLLATLVGILAQQLRVPYSLGLVVMGLFLTLLPRVDVNIPPFLILGLLVPPLVFEGAFNLNLSDLRRNLAPILAMAVPGVVITMLVVGGIVALGTQLPLNVAFVLGAVVAASDPVAVIALFRRIGVPKRLQVLLEGESLLNDGTAIVIFGLVTSLALHQTNFNLVTSLVDFIRISGGGVVVGLTLGYVISQLINRIDDYLIETTLTTILAFGSYLVAEEVFHVSGVLAVVAAGLVTGNVGPAGMSPTTRIVLFNFWEYAAFLANSFIFLLIGFQIDLSKLITSWQSIAIAILAVLAARAFIVYGLAWIGKDIPLRWQHVMNWGGLRGAISLALALSLPVALGPARAELQVMAFGVVVFTLLMQGSTMSWLVRRLGLGERTELQLEYERRHARAVAMQAAYDHLAHMRRTGLLTDHTWQSLSPMIEEHSQALVRAVKDVMAANPSLETEEWIAAHRESLQVQRSTLTGLLKDGVISESIYTELVSEVDTALTREASSWPELSHYQRSARLRVDRLIAAVIQEQDLESAASTLTKMGFSITHLPSVGAFLGRRNVTLLIGLPAGQEEAAVEALSKSCKQRVEYIATPLEGAPFPLPSPVAITVGGATIFVFEVETYEEV